MLRPTITMLAALLAWSAAATASEPPAGWALTVSPEGVCLIGADYAFGRGLVSRLVFAVADDNRTLRIANWREDFELEPGTTYEVAVRVDQGAPLTATAEVLERRMFAISVPIAPSIVAALMTGQLLLIDTARSTLSFTLDRTDQALRALLACALDREGERGSRETVVRRGRDPFR